jgi:hypothetical protein
LASRVSAIKRRIRVWFFSSLLELNAESFHQRAAASNKRAQAEALATTITDNQNEGET